MYMYFPLKYVRQMTGARSFVPWPYTFPHTYNVDFDDFSINTPYSLVKSFRTVELYWTLFNTLDISTRTHIPNQRTIHKVCNYKSVENTVLAFHGYYTFNP